MSSRGRSGGALIRPQHRNLISNKNHNCNARGAKLLRLTEQYWKEKGANVRSTMWAGARGGAPFAAACMTLLAQHGGPIWPLRVDGRRGCVLTESFPAGQLRQWKQHHFGYNGAAAASLARRVSILNWMQQKRGLQIGAPNRNLAAMEGLIAVHT
jgi:hypothetical protein